MAGASTPFGYELFAFRHLCPALFMNLFFRQDQKTEIHDP